MSDHNAVQGAERLVGGLLSVGFASMAIGMQRASAVAAQDTAHVAYLHRVDAAARAAVRQNAAAKLSGTAALIEAYNRRRKATAQK